MTTTSAVRVRPGHLPATCLTALLLVAGSPSAALAQAAAPVPSASPAPAAPRTDQGPAFVPMNPTPAPAPTAAPATAPATAAAPATATPAPVATPAAPAPAASPAPVAPVAAPTPATPPTPTDGIFVRKRTPRSIGLWLGWAWNAVNYLPMRPDGAAVKPHGASFVFDYGWQVGGLRPNGWPTYVGFLLGTTFYPGMGDQRSALTLEYGLLVRHHLKPQWKVHPFLAYGLGAIQAWVFNVDGRGIGHLTRLSVGLEGKVHQKVRLAFELIYKIDPIRAFRVSEPANPKFDIHTLSAMFGVNFSL